MKVLGIIPARAGSKGVPGKNIKLLGNLPLIAYTIKSAMASRLLSSVIVSSDSEEVLDCARSIADVRTMMRPPHLASDEASSIAVVQHVLHTEMENGSHYDAICLLQPTSPFRSRGFIDNAIKKFISLETDALVSVLPVPDEYNPHWVFEPDQSGNLHISTGEKNIISRRQDLPASFFRDGSIYLTRSEVALVGSFFGQQFGFIEGDSELYVNIDNQSDWVKAESMLPTALTKI